MSRFESNEHHSHVWPDAFGQTGRTVELSSTAYSVAEDAGAATIPVMGDGDTSGVVTV